MDYDLAVYDVMGTVAPISHPDVMSEELKKPDIAEKIAEVSGVSDVAGVIDIGRERMAAGDKDSEESKAYLQMYDIGAPIVYRSGRLAMPLQDDGVVETLEHLHDVGVRLRVYASGGTESSEEGFRTAGINEFFEKYHTSSDIGSKSDPASFRKIAKNAGVHDSRAVYVADSLKEVEAAVKAGYGMVFQVDPDGEQGLHDDGYFVIHNNREVLDELGDGIARLEETIEGAEAAE